MLDALCSKGGIIGTRKEDYSVQDVPLYWSNVSSLIFIRLYTGGTDLFLIFIE
jgi:hypothetical protein